MADTLEARRRSRVTSGSAPDILNSSLNSSLKDEDDDQQFDPQQRQHDTAVQPRKSADAAEHDLFGSSRNKRPHVPYSQREIYEKKSAPARRPPARPTPSRRSTASSADGSSSPVHPSITSPSYSQARAISSPSMAVTPTAARSTGGGTSRSHVVTPTRAAPTSVPASATPHSACPTAPQELPSSSAHRPAAASELPRPPPSDTHHHHNPQTAMLTPNNARGRGFISPGTGLRAANIPAPATLSTPGTVHSPTIGSNNAAAPTCDATPQSARLGRTQSVGAERPPPPPAPTKPSPAKSKSLSQVVLTPQTGRAAAAGGLSPGRSGAATFSPSAASPQPAWNPSTSRAATPGSSNPIRTPSNSAWRPPRKPQEGIRHGAAVAAANGPKAPAAAPAADRNRGGNAYERSSAAPAEKNDAAAELVGGMEDDVAVEAESLGLIDLEACDSCSLSGSKAAQADVPGAKGAALGSAVAGCGGDASEASAGRDGGSGLSRAQGGKSEEGKPQSAGTATAAAEGAAGGQQPEAHELASRGCGCIVM